MKQLHMANWNKIFKRGNVEDRRAFGPSAVGGITGTGILIYLIINLLSDGQIQIPLDQLQNMQLETQQNPVTTEYDGNDSYEVFASTVLGSNNDTWEKLLPAINVAYNEPTLVLFRTATDTACGYASSEIGPFYCPLDKTIYLDETFFDELTSRFGAKGGDVAQAYVIAHEIGHHVQNEMGLMSSNNPEEANDFSIKLELQADCFAGIWANSIKDLGVLEPNEINEAMDAASAVGDDRIQKSVTGYVNPETWTHGSSEQRLTWFTRGYDSGQLAMCDTFAN